MKPAKARNRIAGNFFLHLFILMFPVILIIIMSHISNNCGAIGCSTDGLLSYYGTIFGLGFSVFQFLATRRKEQLEKDEKAIPKISVVLSKQPNNENIFSLSIHSRANQHFSDITVYDELFCSYLSTTVSKTISFNLPLQVANEYNCINIKDSDIPFSDGFPDYVQLTCCDIERRVWVCDFDRVKMGDQYIYVPSLPYLP